jgi:hypothetical protein
MLKHPHPDPPPQAGEGAQRRCRRTFGLICDCPARKRETERTFFLVAIKPNFIML